MVVGARTQQQQCEQRQPERRDQFICQSKMRPPHPAEKHRSRRYGDQQTCGSHNDVVMRKTVNRRPEPSGGQQEFDSTSRRKLQRIRKKQGQILGPAFPHRWKAAIHAGFHGIRRITKTEAAATTLHRLGERDILEERRRDRCMAADPIVSFTTNQEELSVRRGGRRCGIADFAGPIGARQFGEDDRHQRTLEQSMNFLARRVGEQVGVMLASFLKRPRQRSGKMHGIGIGEKQPFTSGLIRSGLGRIALSR